MSDIITFTKGFNRGYELHIHDPQLAQSTMKGLQDKGHPFVEGFQLGIEEAKKERTVQEKLNSLRGKAASKLKNWER